MAESTFSYDGSDDEQRIELQFNEVDVESQIKLQNHYMLMYQGHTLTESEMRKHVGKDPLSDVHREDTYLQRIEKQKADWSAQAEVDKAHAVAANRQQPTNQHKKLSGPTKKKSMLEKDSVVEEIYEGLISDLKKLNSENINVDYINHLFLATRDRIKRRIRSKIENSGVRGLSSFPLTFQLQLELQAITSVVFRNTERDIDRLFREAAVKTIAQLSSKDYQALAIEILQYRIRFIEKTRSHQTYILSKIAAMRANRVSLARISCNPDGEHYNVWHDVVIDLTNITPGNMPELFNRPNCECDLSPEVTNAQ
jgi:hypothetical protein